MYYKSELFVWYDFFIRVFIFLCESVLVDIGRYLCKGHTRAKQRKCSTDLVHNIYKFKQKSLFLSSV